jgi:uncharacterized protein involved in outer membrane biogenesis
VDWSGVGLGFFRDFPNVTLGLNEPTVVGVGRFEGDTLASMESLRIVLDLGSVVRSLRNRGPVVVPSVRLQEPDVRLRVLEDGPANWNIVASRPADTAAADAPGPPASGDGARGLEVELRDVEIGDGRLALENDRSGLFASLEGLRHSLDGRLSQGRWILDTRTRAERTTVRFARDRNVKRPHGPKAKVGSGLPDG